MRTHLLAAVSAAVSSIAISLAAASLSACSSTPPADPAADAAALARAQGAARDFGAALRAKLVAELQGGGPVPALTVCADEAPAIAARTTATSGVRVGRSSLRLRNAANAPPPWVDDWLRAQGERPAAGVTGLTAFADTPDGRVARMIKPLPVEAPCLLCHGAPDTLAQPLRDALRQRYPADRATGYALGDLRGALWAEAPVR